VLGCTHFPHLVAWFAAALGAEVQIVDPGAACAALAAERIGGLAAQEGRIAFEVSGDPEEFAANATALSGVDIHTLTHVRL
jgi:glutamate racemase